MMLRAIADSYNDRKNKVEMWEADWFKMIQIDSLDGPRFLEQ